MNQQLIFNILLTIVCIGSFNWILYANNKDIVSLVSKGNDKLAKFLYSVFGLAGIGFLGYYFYYLKGNQSSVCSL